MSAIPVVLARVDLLTVRAPRTRGERALRVLRFTASDGSVGRGDFFDFGLPSGDLAATLARVVDRYAAQGRGTDVFELDPSGRPLGLGEPLLGRPLSSASPRPGQWWGAGRAGLVAALLAARAQVFSVSKNTELAPPASVRLCAELSVDALEDWAVAARAAVAAGLTAVALRLDAVFDVLMAANGERPPYVLPTPLLARFRAAALAVRSAVGDEVDLVVNAGGRIAPHGGLARLAEALGPARIRWIEQPVPVRLLAAQAEVRPRVPAPLAYGNDCTQAEDFVQGIRLQAGDVLSPDYGQIGGDENFASALKLAGKAALGAAPRVGAGPFGVFHAARLCGADHVLWLSAPHLGEWIRPGGVFASALAVRDGRLVPGAAPVLDETRFEVTRIATHTPAA